SRKDRRFVSASYFGEPLRINDHGASDGNQISSQFDSPLSIDARFDPTACHDRATTRYNASKFGDRIPYRGLSLLNRAIINTGLSRRSAQAIVIERNRDVVEI